MKTDMALTNLKQVLGKIKLHFCSLQFTLYNVNPPCQDKSPKSPKVVLQFLFKTKI